jgi:hypothetical protein
MTESQRVGSFTIAQKSFSCLNRLLEFGILTLVESPWFQKVPHMSHDDLVQEHLTQVSHLVHLLMFSAFLAFDQRLCSHDRHEND